MIGAMVSQKETKKVPNYREIVEIVKSEEIRIFGPNIVGITNTATSLVTATYPMCYSKIKRGMWLLLHRTA